MNSSSRRVPAHATARTADLPLLILLGSITVPLFGGGVYVLFLELAASTKMTIALCIAAIAVPMAALMGYIVANPPLRGVDAS